MKRILLTHLLLFFTLISFAANDEVKVTVQYTKPCDDVLAVSTSGGVRQVFKMDENMQGSVTLTDFKAGYVRLQSGAYQRLLYLQPGHDLKINITPSDAYWYKAYSYEGASADINNYLLMSDSLVLSVAADYKLNAEDYINKLKNLTAQNITRLDGLPLDENFKKVERIRLKYLVHNGATRYLVQHFWDNPEKMTGVEIYSDVPEVKVYLETLLVDDPAYWDIDACRGVYTDVISALTRDQAMSEQFYDCMISRCKYVKEKFKSDRLKEELMQKFATIYTVRQEGADMKEIQVYYDEMVKNPEYRQELADQKQTFNMLRKGADFKIDDYMDIHGKMVNFNDLKGKYVYIDVWATWCGPCCQEIEPLKALEEKMHGKNIYFVSLSVDANKEAWIKKVKKDNMTGIQLYGGEGAQILKDYSINGIPRFILLDMDGKLIEANMTRPSDPLTLKTLSELEGI